MVRLLEERHKPTTRTGVLDTIREAALAISFAIFV